MQEIIHLINEMSPYLLLGFFLAGLMHAFIPGNYYTKHLSRPTMGSVVKAALFGVPLPLCSCGVIPTAMSLRREGASRGAVTSFLIATPQTGIDSIIATFSLMGLPFALLRPVAAMAMAVFGGCMANLFAENGGHEAAMDDSNAHCCCHCCCKKHKNFMQKMGEALNYAFVEMMEDIGKWLVIGIIAAGAITVLVPDSLFSVFHGNTWASMLLVLAIAIPMYLCATGSIPITVILMLKGLTPGAALVLLMAGPACNMASILVVRNVLGTRTLLVYLASIILGSVAFGILVDAMQFGGAVNFLGGISSAASCCGEAAGGWFSWGCTAALAALLINALIIRRFFGKQHIHANS